MSVKIESLHFYPVKSCAGLTVDELEISSRGPLYDREWMIVKAATGEFLTQRQQQKLALVKPTITSRALTLSIPGHGEVDAPFEGDFPLKDVTVWKDLCRAELPSPLASQALSDYLGEQVELVRIDPDFRRLIPEKYGFASAHTGFADQFPILLVNLDSLAELNSRLGSAVPIDRFRANIVISGAGEFAEDGWKDIRVGDLEMTVSKPCSRCVIINTDQETGARGVEPLKTLSTYRRVENRVMFGQYLIHHRHGRLRLGDKITTYESR